MIALAEGTVAIGAAPQKMDGCAPARWQATVRPPAAAPGSTGEPSLRRP